MASTSEIGHAKNVANFEDLISYCTGYGSAYNPNLAAIKIANMNTLKNSANTALTNVVLTFTAFKNATNAREIVFLPIKKLSTRIINALRASGVPEQTIKDALTINRKIQGKKLKTVFGGKEKTAVNPNDPPVEVPEEPKEISSSQQSYDSMIEHFSKLIDLLTSQPLYVPNEADLKLTALNTLLASMKTSNTAVITATTNVSNSRISRNYILYKIVTGLVDVAFEVKSYVKSVFGAKSPEYKQVSGLKFTKRKI